MRNEHPQLSPPPPPQLPEREKEKIPENTVFQSFLRGAGRKPERKKPGSITEKEYDEITISSIRKQILVYNNILSPSINIDTFISQLYLGQAENKKLEPIWDQLYPILSKYKNDKVNLAPLYH